MGDQPPPPPPPPPCNSTAIVNNTDTSGKILQQLSFNQSVFGEEGAKECRRRCCETAGCARWTYTDPQPGSQAHDCWLVRKCCVTAQTPLMSHIVFLCTSAIKHHQRRLKDNSGSIIPGSTCDQAGHCWSGEMHPPSVTPFRRVITPFALAVNDGPDANLTSYDRGQFLLRSKRILCHALVTSFSGARHSY